MASAQPFLELDPPPATLRARLDGDTWLIDQRPPLWLLLVSGLFAFSAVLAAVGLWGRSGLTLFLGVPVVVFMTLAASATAVIYRIHRIEISPRGVARLIRKRGRWEELERVPLDTVLNCYLRDASYNNKDDQVLSAVEVEVPDGWTGTKRRRMEFLSGRPRAEQEWLRNLIVAHVGRFST